MFIKITIISIIILLIIAIIIHKPLTNGYKFCNITTIMTRKRLHYVTGTSIHIDEWLYETSQEIMDVITNFAGRLTYQESFLTLSDTILTLISYSVQFQGLASEGEKVLIGLLDAANKKTPAITVSINYGNRFKSIIDTLIAKYRAIGTKISFGEAARVALYNAINVYNREPEKVLIPLMMIISLSNPVLTNKAEYESIEDITSFSTPSFDPSLGSQLKDYFMRIPNYFADTIINKGKQGMFSLNQLAIKKLKVDVALPTSYKELYHERVMDSVDSTVSEISAFNYILCVVAAKNLNDMVLRETFGSAESLTELSQIHSTILPSNSAYSLILTMLIFHSSFVQEVKTAFAERVRPFFILVINRFFPE